MPVGQRHLYMTDDDNRVAASMINTSRTRQSIEEILQIVPKTQ